MAAVGQGIPVPARQTAGFVRPNIGVLVALLTLACAAAFPVFVRSDASTRGQDMQQLELRRGLLTGEIRQLEASLAELASVDRIQRDAISLGMVPADDDLYVQVDTPAPADLEVPFAFRPAAAVDPLASDDSPWWRDLLDSLPFR
jgi:hypothetical protein